MTTEQTHAASQALPSHQRMMELWAEFSEFTTPFLMAERMAWTDHGRDALERCYTLAVNLYLANRRDLLSPQVVASWMVIDDQINAALVFDSKLIGATKSERLELLTVG